MNFCLIIKILFVHIFHYFCDFFSTIFSRRCVSQFLTKISFVKIFLTKIIFFHLLLLIRIILIQNWFLSEKLFKISDKFFFFLSVFFCFVSILGWICGLISYIKSVWRHFFFINLLKNNSFTLWINYMFSFIWLWRSKFSGSFVLR